jgi:hypothetical protein
MKKNIIIFILICFHLNSQNFPVDLGYGNNISDHYDKIKLKDISFNCEDYFLYPVFIEDFNHLSDVEQNFQFWFGYTHNENVKSSDCTKNFEDKSKPVTYYGDNTFAKQNGNVKCENGKLILERKRQDVTINNYSFLHFCVNQNDFPYTYNFTNAILKSFFKVRKGIVEGVIKVPKFPYLWSAFWLYAGEPTRQEIDIFEYIPNNDLTLSGNCINKAPYSYYNFTVHNEYISPNLNEHYQRVAKFLPSNWYNFLNWNNFLDVSHKYTLYWDDYKVDLYLDDMHKVRGRKYVSKKDKDFTGCGELIKGPEFSWSCSGANAQKESSPNKKIKIDKAFPIDDRAMEVIISEGIHYKAFKNNQYYNNLLNDFNNLPDINKKIIVDRLVVYQPVLLDGNLTIPNLNTFYTHSRNSSFLAANKIEFGPNASIHVHTPAAPNWNQVSMHAIAAEHIIITDEFIYEEGNHLRLETADFSCSGFSYSSKFSNGWDEVVYDLEEDDEENEKVYEGKKIPEMNELFHPNPVMHDLHFNAEFIDIIKVTDVAGKEIKPEINNNKMDVSGLNKGVYFIFYRNKKTNERSIWKFIKE